MKKLTTQQRTMRVAFCGMMTALSVALMLLGGLLPLMTYISPLVAGLLLAVVLLEYNSNYAWLTWLATVFCTLVLGSDKEASVFYLFFGYYPILKPVLDSRISRKGLRVAVKLAVFTLSAVLMFLFLLLLFPTLGAEFTQMSLGLMLAWLLVQDLCLLVYDHALPVNMALYRKRIRPHMRFIHR